MSCRIQFAGLEADSLVGDPVNAVTGANVDARLEFQMPGPLPFRWVQYYDSSKSHQSFALGWGRTHGYDHWLQFDADGLRYSAPVGRVVGFPPLLADGERFAIGGYTLQRVSALQYLLHHTGEPSLEFQFRDRTSTPVARMFRGQDSIHFHYSQDRLEQIVDSRGRGIAVVTSLLNNDNGRIVALVLADSNNGPNGTPITNYRYDAAGNLVQGLDPLRNQIRYQYDRNNREVTRADRLGHSFHFEYDSHGRCTRTSGDGDLHDTRLEYHPQEGVTLVTRADGGRWTYLCPDGQLTRIIDPYGGARNFKRDEGGRIVEEIDPNGNVTRLSYDNSGKLSGRVFPLGHFCGPDDKTTPPIPNQHDLPTDPLGWHFGNLYRSLGLSDEAHLGPVRGVLSRSLPQRFQLHLRANSPEPTPSGFEETAGEFDEWTAQHFPDGSARHSVYDAAGNLTRLIDRDGSQYSYVHAPGNLRTRVVNPLGFGDQRQYTPTEQLAAFADRGGTVSKYEYDLKDRLIRVHRHGVVKEEYRYDQADNFIEKLDGNGARLLSFEIGAGNLIAARHLASGQKHSFQWDKKGRLLAAHCESPGKPAAKSEIAFEYDSFGNRTSDQRNGIGVEHKFAGTGALRETTYFGRFVVKYQRDAAGTLTIVDPRGHQHKIEAVDNDFLLRTAAHGSVELAKFGDSSNGARCLLKIARFKNRQGAWARQYTYSHEGDLLQTEDSLRGSVQYKYDAAHRLIGLERANGETRSFTHDPGDNLISQPGLTGVTFIEGNRLATANGAQFEYNQRNHISVRKNVTGETRYVYDSLDMLTACESLSKQGQAYTWQAEYDALSRRISKTTLGQTTQYYWDTDRLAAEISGDLEDGGTVRLYVYADERALTPIFFLEYDNLEADAASATCCHIYTDHLAAPLLVEDETGQTVWEAHLDPYGIAHISPNSTITLNLRFPGHHHDPETGLHYNRYRYYSPELGRYLQSDPIGISGGPNLYGYTTNPLKRVDALGLCPDGKPDPDKDGQTNGSQEKAKVVAEETPGEAEARAASPPADPSTLVKGGQIDHQAIQQWAQAHGLTNEWTPSPVPGKFASGGFKYRTQDGTNEYTIHGHGANPSAPQGSNASAGPTASITRRPVGGGNPENFRQDGTWGTSNSDKNGAHVPLDNSPY